MEFLYNTPKYQKKNALRAEHIEALLKDCKSDEERFQMSRRYGIGGSDIAKLMGKSKWQTPFQLWQDKTLRTDEMYSEENVFTHWGTLLEQPIKKEYWDLVGHNYGDYMEANIAHRHTQLGCVIGNLDGLIYKNDKPVRVVEIKTAVQNSASGEFNEFGQAILSWGDGNIYQTEDDKVLGVAVEDAQIPLAYYYQVQLYMEVVGVNIADLAVLLGHHDFRIFTIHADRKLQKQMLNIADEFWCTNVLDDTPPELTAQDYDVTEPTAEKVTINPESRALYDNLIQVRNKIKALTAKKETLEDKLKEEIGMADMLVDGSGKPLITYKSSAVRKSLDSAKLKKELPEVYNKYLKQNPPARRFMVREYEE